MRYKNLIINRLTFIREKDGKPLKIQTFEIKIWSFICEENEEDKLK